VASAENSTVILAKKVRGGLSSGLRKIAGVKYRSTTQKSKDSFTKETAQERRKEKCWQPP